MPTLTLLEKGQLKIICELWLGLIHRYLSTWLLCILVQNASCKGTFMSTGYAWIQCPFKIPVNHFQLIILRVWAMSRVLAVLELVCILEMSANERELEFITPYLQLCHSRVLHVSCIGESRRPFPKRLLTQSPLDDQYPLSCNTLPDPWCILLSLKPDRKMKVPCISQLDSHFPLKCFSFGRKVFGIVFATFIT